MNKELRTASIFLQKHSLIFFTIAVALGLAAVIILCYQTYTTATTPGEIKVNDITPTSFDVETEKRIKTLHTRDQANIEVDIPKDRRINPFVE